MSSHPMQPIVIGEDGVPRFQENPIVRFMLEAGPFDLNQLLLLPGITADDKMQLMQLIGTTVDGYAEMESFVSKESIEAADQEVERLQQ